MKNIVFIGSGAIATALGDLLAVNDKLSVTLLSIESEVIESIKKLHYNLKYFPNFKLSKRLRATSSVSVLKDADVVFLAIPSVAVVDYLRKHAKILNSNALVVNLAKGFGDNMQLIPDCISNFLPNKLAMMKGPSFAREILDGQATAFTIASHDKEVFPKFDELFNNTAVYLDTTDDVTGVEFCSILKNIYAIVIGIVDANFDSPNLRSLVISRAINEMKSLMVIFGGNEKTIFNYCGFGDFSLTALNDLSRNRTLGLLIGKGLFIEDISKHVVLEGRIAVDVFHEKLVSSNVEIANYPLMNELFKVFHEDAYDIKSFVKRILTDEVHGNRYQTKH